MQLAIAFLSLSIVLNSASNLILKFASSSQGIARAAKVVLGLALGVCNVLVYSRSLEKIRLSIAYPALSIGSIVVITAVSALIFKDPLPVKTVAGIGFAMFGVFLISTAT
jgi:multidrug transporter EmrE-like cation transporter